jgi:ornithine cyclodeaminase/alanine dehydrogenase-like protein (mu-crystallin family)
MDRLLHDQTTPPFIEHLAREIEATYLDKNLKRISPRVGWSKKLDTQEIMGCRSTDFSCVKLISSNPSRAGRSSPVVSGTMLCTSVPDDRLRLNCEAARLTSLRTAVSTGVVMRRVIPEAATLGIIGAGLEGTTHARVLATMLPGIRRVMLADIDADRSKKAADDLSQLVSASLEDGSIDRSIEVIDCGTRVSQACDTQLIVTATYGTTAALTRRNLLPERVVIAAVGADLHNKRELDWTIYDEARFIADDLTQCLAEGELQYLRSDLNIAGGRIDDHRGCLDEGRVIGVADLLEEKSRSFRNGSATEYPVLVYDSTGFAGQDLAAARVLIDLLDGLSWSHRPWEADDEKV